MARIDKVKHDDITFVQRAWGHELWIENDDEYCGKLLFVKKGCAGSMHYHFVKKETMYLQSGHVYLDLIDKDTGHKYRQELLPGDKILLEPGQAHRIIGAEDSELFEFSTKHYEEDSYRVSPGWVSKGMSDEN